MGIVMRPGGPSTDWESIRKRLERATEGLRSTGELSPERAREVLRERARALAGTAAATETRPGIEIVTFRLGMERYGIEARYVREVGRVPEYTPVPGLPRPFVGVTNLRGEIVPILDLAAFLAVSRTEATDRSRLIVLGAEDPELALLADETYEVVEITEEALEMAPAREGVPGREILRGVTGEALIVLDGALLLADERFFFQEEEDDVVPVTVPTLGAPVAKG